MSRPIGLDGDERAHEQRAEQEVGLPQQQFVRVELRHQDDGEQQQGPLRQAPIGQSGDRPAQQSDEEARPRWRTRASSRCPGRAAPNGAIITREQRKVLELVMAVFRPVERFGVQRAHGRLPPRDEVDHLVADPRVVDDDGQQSEREKSEGPESRRHVRSEVLELSPASRERPPPQADEAGGNQHGANADGRQLHEVGVERPPQQVEDGEAREEEPRQGDRAPGGDRSRHRSTRHM